MDEEIKEIKTDPQPVVTLPPQTHSWQQKLGVFLSGFKSRLPGLPKGRFLGIIFVILVILAVLIGIPLAKAYNDGKKAYAMSLQIKDALKNQDIKKVDLAIAATRKQLATTQGDLTLIGWTKFIPFIGGYTSDTSHLLQAADSGLFAAGLAVTAVEPYADLVGFSGQGSFSGGTTEQRIAVLVQTLDKVIPQIDDISKKITDARKQVDMVNPKNYPETLFGKPVREKVVQLQEIVDLTDQILTEARPMVKQLPTLLGVNKQSTYLVLFQNDKELRPTGGFITAYAIFRVEKGKISLNVSDDIYKLDDTISKHVSPPDPIAKYLNVYGWRLRDSNFSPDFASSMKTFEDLYASSSAKDNVDGIIAVDTHVLLRFMDILSPIQVYGTNFTTKKEPICDCPMVIYELEKYADEPKNYERGSRKDIIGVLLSTLMQKAMASGKGIYGPLFTAALEEANQKHILFYLHNEDAQKGIEALGFGGRIKSVSGDYLHINDANLAGAKSNLYITQNVKQDVTVTDFGADVTLTMEYRYPHEADNCSLERKSGLCLAGIYRDYLRVYLPAGTKVGEVVGFENRSTTFEDLGHTVADGFFTVVPQGLAKIVIKYKVPGTFKKDGVYKALIQKQPGTDAVHYQITVNGKKLEFNLVADKELTIKL